MYNSPIKYNLEKFYRNEQNERKNLIDLNFKDESVIDTIRNERNLKKVNINENFNSEKSDEDFFINKKTENQIFDNKSNGNKEVCYKINEKKYYLL